MDNISKDEIFALLFLLEKHLFKKEFKIDKRVHDTIKDRRDTYRGGRRKIDKDEILTTSSENMISTTHQELLLKSGVKEFTNNLEDKDKNGKLLNAYI